MMMTKIRKLNVVLVSALVAAGVSAITIQGCGSSSPDYTALCNQGCAKVMMCLGSDEAMCKQQCTSMTTTCTNSAAIASAYQKCVNMTCDTFLTCLGTLPPCQTAGGGQGGSSGGGTGGSSGGGTGGSTGSAGCAACTKANTCCIALFTAAQMPTTSCSAYSASTCNGQDATTQAQTISICNQVVAAGASANIAACR
jgi:hypothetical protein